MFERFTDQARQVLVLAQDEAQTLGHDHIGTGHILLGLLRQPETIAAQALASLGADLEAARKQVASLVAPAPPPTAGIPFTPRVKVVLKLAGDEAMLHGVDFTAPEQILLGLVREGAGTGVQVMKNLGVDPGAVREQVGQLAGAPAGGPALFARLRRRKFK